MRLSQLTRRMMREDALCVRRADGETEQTVYTGCVRGIAREDPINRAFVLLVRAAEGAMIVTVTDPPGGGMGNGETK